MNEHNVAEGYLQVAPTSKEEEAKLGQLASSGICPNMH